MQAWLAWSKGYNSPELFTVEPQEHGDGFFLARGCPGYDFPPETFDIKPGQKRAVIIEAEDGE